MSPLRIIVPVKQVPETGKARMDEETGTIQREGVESIINPLDLYAIETALRIAEAHDGEVVALSMGPPGAREALREAIAMGCDRAVLLSSKDFAGSDTFATSYTLSQAVRTMGGFDLIICGERATDGDTGQVGPAKWNWIRVTLLSLSIVSLLITGTVPEHFLQEHLWDHVVRQHLPRIFAWTRELTKMLTGLMLR